MSKPLVGIVILNYNSFELTNTLIDNIHNTISYDNYQIIVVDNCSTNDSAVKIAEFCNNLDRKDITLIASVRNGGYAAGNNIGIKQAEQFGAEYVLVVNNDVIITEPKTLDILVDTFEKNENVGVVSPKIMRPDGIESMPIFFRRPSAWDLTFGYFNYVKSRYKQVYNGYKEIYAPRGSCMMMEVKTLKKINYLDEYTFLFYEEQILAERMLLANKTVMYNGYVSVVHNHSQTIANNVKKKFILENILRGMRYYLKEYRHFPLLVRESCILIKKLSFDRKRI